MIANLILNLVIVAVLVIVFFSSSKINEIALNGHQPQFSSRTIL